MKRYLPTALETIRDTHMTTETHTKKVVQMHMLAKNFADQLARQVQKDELVDFGQPLQYGKVHLGLLYPKQVTDKFKNVFNMKEITHVIIPKLPCSHVQIIYFSA